MKKNLTRAQKIAKFGKGGENSKYAKKLKARRQRAKQEGVFDAPTPVLDQGKVVTSEN